MKKLTPQELDHLIKLLTGARTVLAVGTTQYLCHAIGRASVNMESGRKSDPVLYLQRWIMEMLNGWGVYENWVANPQLMRRITVPVPITRSECIQARREWASWMIEQLEAERA